MDRIKQYSKPIQKVLENYLKSRGNIQVKENGEFDMQGIFDEKNHHYQVTFIGWQSQKRVFFTVFHPDIMDGKVWVQEAASEFDVVGELEHAGIPKGDIVLAFHAPYKRKYTGYAA